MVLFTNFGILLRLSRAGFSFTSFSIIVVHETRPNVARMISVSHSTIAQLVVHTESIMSCVLAWSPDKSASTRAGDLTGWLRVNATESLLRIYAQCRNIFPYDPDLTQPVVHNLQLLVHTLDLAVVVYSGAHTSDFTTKYIDSVRVT